MGWVDAIKFCIGATIAHSKARAKSCSISGKSNKIIVIKNYCLLHFCQFVDNLSPQKM